MGLPPRRSLTVSEPARNKLPGAPHPNFFLVVRFLLTGLVCLLSLATAIIAILVVDYYNKHDPIIRPSWGSLIFLIILGLFTPIIYFGYNIFLPLMPFINYGDFLYSLFMVKIELLLQFAMAVLWVSGALAYACDLRGKENCQFDGYWHYEKPANFDHVCKLIEYAVGFAYATFGVQAALMVVEFLYGMYIFLFLDQESLNEPHFEWGRRAYNYAQQSKQQQRQAAIGRSPRATALGGAGGAAAGAGAAGVYRNMGRRSPATESVTSQGTSERTESRRGAGYNDPDMESRTSAPVSLGSRGRRGVAYGGMADDDEESQIAGRPRSAASTGGGEGGPLASAAAGAGAGAKGRKTSSRGGGSRRASRRGPLSDEESGWHLREDDSER